MELKVSRKAMKCRPDRIVNALQRVQYQRQDNQKSFVPTLAIPKLLQLSTSSTNTKNRKTKTTLCMQLSLLKEEHKLYC